MPEYWEKADHSWTKDSLRYINTPSKKSQELFYFIQEIGHFKAYKPYYTERENLPSFLMKYTLSGQGKLLYKNKNYILEKGDVFFIDCMNYQHYYTSSIEPWEMDWIHFYGSQSKAFYREFIKNGDNKFTSDNNRIHQLMTNLLNLQNNKNAKTDFAISVLIHELLNELIIQKNKLDFEMADIPEYVLDMRTFLDEHIQSVMSLKKLETIYRINKYQLDKEFSKYIGVPPIDYHISNKISYSKDLLRYSNMSVKEVAFEIGMENSAYFSRLFKKKTGLSPSTFRKNG